MLYKLRKIRTEVRYLYTISRDYRKEIVIENHVYLLAEKWCTVKQRPRSSLRP